MKIILRWLLLLCVGIPLSIAVSCNSDGLGGASVFSVGGSVSGLSGTLVLTLTTNNGASPENLSLTTNGAFTFPSTNLFEGNTYTVSVSTQPNTQTCVVSDGSGTIANSNITNVSIDCSNPTPGANISFVGVNSQSILFTWGKATDANTPPSELQYKAVISTNLNDLDTIDAANALTGSNIVKTWTPNLSEVQAQSLSPSTTYYVAVLVRNNAGNIALYSPQSTTTFAGKQIFVSSIGRDGNMGGVFGADDMCTIDPDVPALGTYKAMIVDGVIRIACTTADCLTGGSSENINWVLTPDTVYVHTDNTPIGTSNGNGIFTFPLSSSFGNSSVQTWTGMNADWKTGNTCTTWTVSTFPPFGAAGFDTNTDSGAIYTADKKCNENTGYLICVEQ